MLYKILLFLVFSYSLIFSDGDQFKVNEHSVNAVIGDVSFVDKFGFAPDNKTNETLRLTTHLEYVEKKLRKADVSHLSSELKEKRFQLLNYLREYIEAESYPKNYHHPNKRQSVFIDINGNICAVGYLVERSVDRQTAEKINKDYKFSSIFEIDNSFFKQWISESGFTKKELAMIQPAYGPNPEEDINQEYDIASSVLIGVNTSLSFVNASQIFRGRQNKTIPILGLVTGSTQLIMGIANYPNNSSVNKRNRELSLLNIGFSTLTISLSSYNLFKNKENPENSYTFRLKNFSLPQNNSGMGISVTKSF